MSRCVHVELDERGYDIRIGASDLTEGLCLQEGTAVLVVSDSNVDPLYGDRWQARLEDRGLVVTRTVVPAGEASKQLDRLNDIYDAALGAGLDRRATIVALGGGMVGDLAGFAAATYLRGVRFVQVPTTLLAMVDSAVGGKTAVNLPQGKNLVGAFYQPLHVAADLRTLASLADREYLSGLGEVVKYGIIWDAAFFTFLEENVDALTSRDLACLEEVVARCCEIKAEVVAIDERESGVRAILNFGHTLAHSLEAACGYGAWLHGEAVAVGMVYAAALSRDVRGFAGDDVARIRELLARLGLPVSAVRDGVSPEWEALRAVMATDKKSENTLPRFVLAEKMGAVVFGCDIEEAALTQAYEDVT